VKTIVFSATVAHGEELCKRFQDAGFNFQQVSYKDGNDEKRRALIEEFRKPTPRSWGSCRARRWRRASTCPTSCAASRRGRTANRSPATFSSSGA
jgi:hypothetical protein